MTGDVSLDHLIKVVSAEFLYYKIIIFLFVINKHLSKDIFKVWKYSVSPQTVVF